MRRQNKVTKFFDNNETLVEEYNNIVGGIDLRDLSGDIIQKFNNSPKLQKSQESVLREALGFSIENQCDIFDSLNHVMNKEFDCNNTIQMYFKDVGRIYTQNNDDFDIEYCPENRDKLIKMNLKSAISIAKQYQNRGVPLEDLISAANLGLCKAYDKFDPSKSTLQEVVIKEFEELPEEIHGNEIITKIGKFLDYGKLMVKVQKRFAPEKLYKKDIVLKWIKNNIKSAKFSSVAVIWMKACIFNEIDQNSRLVKKPKTDIYKDKEKYGSFIRETTVDMEEYENDEIMSSENNASNIEISDAYNTYKTNIRKLLKPLSPRERSIVLRRFGIGLPRPMSPKEIGQQENLTVARVSQIFQNAIIKLKENAEGFNSDELFEACQYFK